MKSAMLALALLATLTAGAWASETVTSPAQPRLHVQTVGVARPWRGWGVYRPYGAPLGYNRYGYGAGVYGYGYRPYGARYYSGYSPYYYGW